MIFNKHRSIKYYHLNGTMQYKLQKSNKTKLNYYCILITCNVPNPFITVTTKTPILTCFIKILPLIILSYKMSLKIIAPTNNKHDIHKNDKKRQRVAF